MTLGAWKRRVRHLKAETHALYLACKDARTPWYAKLFAAAVVAYAISPIDLIPDFVPVLGYLDDLILVPAGIALALKLIPPPVLAECRERVLAAADRPSGWKGAAVIVVLWILAAALVAVLAARVIGG